jgi:uncharacterized repeat protein (TIGR03803 family)
MRTVFLILCSIILANCSRETGSSPFLSALPNDAATIDARPDTSHFTHLFSFDGVDGAHPCATLLNVKGLLYGTTCGGYGAVFTITPSGYESVLYTFKGYSDGDGTNPQAALLNVNGLLYGTTESGGASDRGTVFTVTRSGYEHALYSFTGDSDGANPLAPLIDVSGLLYGTTSGGGAYGDGTVFTITPSGSEQVLHNFGASGDGGLPYAGLTDVSGVLYGTTNAGGTSGYGTVFVITPPGTSSGDYRVLYNFKGGTDGALPYPALLNVNGVLYGTTYHGGKSDAGTVFTITPSGHESVLYSFKGGTVGADPIAGLIYEKGKLYGTTSKNGGGPTDDGIVFKITKSGKEGLLYRFNGGTDGWSLQAGLTDVNGKLYGTTYNGGAVTGYAPGYGTVFDVSP